MERATKISVFGAVGGSLCVASGDGQKVYERISKTLKAGRAVELSFFNVNTLTSAFLNAAIGQLYGFFSEEQISALLRVKDMEPDDEALLMRVIETAKLYFKDPQRFDRVVRETMEDDDDDA